MSKSGGYTLASDLKAMCQPIELLMACKLGAFLLHLSFLDLDEPKVEKEESAEALPCQSHCTRAVRG